MNAPAILRVGVAVWALFSACDGLAQSFRRAGTEFAAVRSVAVPANKPYSVVVVEFLHHGEIRPDGTNVIVVAKNGDQVPVKILQLGAGDFCRLAFQTVPRQTEYEIYYGGAPPRDSRPRWTCEDGLLLETREFRHCDFGRLASVREAFEASKPIGADYVDGVFQGNNPFRLRQEPFLSRYSGFLHLSKPGTYGFITSSQDCSFLLIDGKLVAAAPGRHGPMARAWRGSRHDVELSAGRHRFEYYHAAGGPHATMVAAWEINPVDQKPQQPSLIPPEAFQTHVVGRLAAGRLSLRKAKLAPDFTFQIAGAVALPDSGAPLIGVLFRDISPKALTMQGAKIQWEFGDGQTSNLPSVDHVYLRPGTYRVTLSIRRGTKSVELTNRIEVDEPLSATGERPHSLAEYMKILETYNAATLDAKSVRQLVLACEAMSLVAANRADDLVRQANQLADDPNRRPDAKRGTLSRESPLYKDLMSESQRWLGKAVAAGQAAFGDRAEAKGDEDLLGLAQLIGPMARNRLGNSEQAFQIWHGAAQRISASGAKAECEVEAADIALNDLLDAAAAKSLLESAAKELGRRRSGAVAATLWCVWGDYHAATNDGSAARKDYLKSEEMAGVSQSFVESAARQGAHARAVEEYIKERQFSRAAEELQTWRRESPGAAIDGYRSLLCARYWAARGLYAQAIAQAERLQAVNPDSPYLDQMLIVAADSEMRRGRKERALGMLQALVREHPGSPLAPLAKKNIELLEKGEN